MKWVLVAFLSFCFITSLASQHFTYWDELNDAQKEKILTRTYTAESIEQFYFGKRSAGDSISMDALMGTLAKADSNQLTFYFKVFCDQMPAYRDSLNVNNYTVHVMNMLDYHPAYVLHYFEKYENQACEAMFTNALDHAFSKMKWFFPEKAAFRKKLARDLPPSQLQILDQWLD